mgnify:CR=1 FL=1
MAIIEVTSAEEYEKEVKNSDKAVFVDFWAPWCMPCKMFTKILEKVAPEEEENFKFVKVNVDEADEEVTEPFEIRSIPTLAIVKNGEVVEKKIGAFQNADDFKKFLEEHK